MSLWNNYGMNRRHFMQHMATAAATIPAINFLSHVQANAATLKANKKSCILMWMGGGPPTIDMWDLKPGAKTGGEFNPIDTAVPGIQISEHMPETAKVFQDLSIVRSMSTREADHGRGRYYMHTGYVPNPTVVHPTFGSVVSYELGRKRTALQIPSFVSVGGGSGQAGFLGMSHAPFVVGTDGQINNAPTDEGRSRLKGRLEMLAVVEKNFIQSKRGELPEAHKDVYYNAVNLMQSPQMAAFDIDKANPQLGLEAESAEARKMYMGDGAGGGMGMGGANGFGQSLLMARRLVEVGVPFVEVNLGGWDLHNDVFNSLKNQRLPTLDRGMAALMKDLKQRGMLDDTVVVWMGEFGRTPRINQNVGRDHWAASWSNVIGGGGLKNGQVIGATNEDGTRVADGSKAYLPGDIWATVAYAMGIPLNTVHTSKRGRPMKLANGGTAISELIG
ncbi:DUF1501 domain-containing protein [Fuerstiella marisgermanici]|uniref:DUF1501 domain-containing protein n=1 Tax=Fuerstiella marisgermanici TaxID=1891926 RepID=A0A1P8WCJ7_9PLAN|nr:DUF1501 domain-containing protein [Fuerstiella marisgermanici]APZ91773.1 hypothetical protein Fuma_01364 [Fuerstiella marisgermanici]